jgi:transitional endoplasmic reticulum ATPase
MSSEFIENVRKKVKEIQQEVCIKEEILQKIVAILLSIKEGKFPSKRPPRGLLFYGPPGTGKTLLMKVLAKKLGLSEPIIIRGPEIISPYYGKSEARLREAFEEAKDKAEKENLAIIFIDEIDSIAPRRDQTRGELEPRLVGQLLSLMDGLEREVSKGHVIVIGSTNRPEALDPALRRPGRFDLEIEFDPPDAEERKRILEILLNEYAKDKYKDINLEEIAEQTIGFTGADLLQLLNESLLLAALEGRNYITQKDLLKAKDSIKPSALREFYMEKPRNRIKEIENKEITKKIEDLVLQFSEKPRFKAVLLHQDISLADKVASTIASLVCEKLACPYVVVRATWFKSKWFGEMERSIRELFERVKRLQPCVVYIKVLDAIAPKVANEHLHGAILEILEYLTEFRDSNVKVLLLCSAVNEIAPQIEEYFDKLELKSTKQI